MTLIHWLYLIPALATLVATVWVYEQCKRRAKMTGAYMGPTHSESAPVYLALAAVWPIGAPIVWLIWRKEVRG